MANQRDINRWKRGKDHWNKWAEDRLKAKEKLEKNGKWEFKNGIPANKASKNWRELASVDFSDYVFEDNADFRGFSFPNSVTFSCAKFNEMAGFDEAIFFGSATFDEVIFSKAALFGRVIFSGNVSFFSTIFLDYAKFIDSTFSGIALFLNVRFYGDAWFYDATFSFHAHFKQSIFDGSTAFDNVEFYNDTSFNAAKSDGPFSLTKAHFSTVPDFIQMSFRAPARLDDIELPQAKPFLISGNKERAAYYRALKKIAIEAHDHVREQDFFASEIKERRGNDDSLMSAPWFFGYAYELLSDFGRSLQRPLGWLGVTILVFAAINCTNTLPKWRSACNWKSDWLLPEFYLSFLHSLPIIGFGRGEKRGQALDCLFGAKQDVSPTMDVLFITQNIWSAILLFLFLLALRNHFKIK